MSMLITNHPPKLVPHLAKYGMSKGLLQHIITTKPVVAKNILPCLSEYYCLYWRGTHFKGSLKDGVITTGSGKKYLVVYHNTTSELAYRAHQLFLSFREPQKEFGLPAYVMVCKSAGFEGIKEPTLEPITKKESS